ncbi:hypothetical protein ACO2Q2_02255 [Dyella sp. KRB-257]|uniref:hypothetical protein n=1 Tax=Dyella sp. KRB-257 TaxID=3400915 RepID=UPI003BFD783E
MPSLPAIRLLRRRHPRWMAAVLALVLTMVTLSTMPRWLTHAHGEHATATMVLGVAQALDHHDVDSGVAAGASVDEEHAHAHYLAGTAFTLPALIDSLPLHLPGSTCPPGRRASAPPRLLATPHRPPIA